jgi:alanyl-tRNA synthetase
LTQGIILDEELAFLRTLEKGIKEFNSKTTSLGVGAVVPKELAFLLYDSCGFPLDLTQVMAEERGWTVDLDGFQQLMNEQKERSRKKSSGSGDKIILQAEQTDFIAKTISASPTDDSAKYSWVSMGTGKPIKAKVLAVWTGKEFKSSATDSDGTVGVLLDRTNFYAEEGGQEFDTGAFSTSDASFDVNDTQKFGPYVLHIGTANGTIAVGAEVECSPDFIRRHKLAANHTMTHVRLLPLLPLLLFLFFPSFRCRSRLYQVLNLALRTHVGPDCNQKGSEVTTAKFRFDFSNSNPVTYEQIEKIEDQVRAIISHGAVVYKRTCSLADARRIRTLRAVFGEVYPDPVRVVSVGADIDALLAEPDSDKWNAISVEFCGGTHLDDAQEARYFAIVQEEGVSKGVRRITGLTGDAAAIALNDGEALLIRLDKAASNANVDELEKDIAKVLTLLP